MRYIIQEPLHMTVYIILMKRKYRWIFKQAKQWRYNGEFAQPLLQWKSKKFYIFWVYVCSHM